MPFFLLWASRARAGPTFKARIMARKSKFAPLQSDPSPLLRLAEGSLRLANAIREQQTKPPPGESENATPAQSAALPASTPPGDSAHEGNGRNGSDKNRVRPDAPRLAGLLPFDAAAALNDLHLGLDNLADVLGDLPFQPKWPNRIVRYSSLPPANLERMLAGLDGFRIELFDPKPQLKVGHIPDGKQTIEWTPDLAHGYRCSSLDAPEQGLDVDDCVFFEIPEGTGAGLLLGCSVAVFLREIEEARADPGGFQEWRDDQIGRWRKVWQHAERFELRMHGGHIQELDAPVWATENLNEVYQRFANLRAKCGGFNSTPPQWAVEKDSVAPVDLKTVRELDGLLWGPGSDCALYRSVTWGTFTADGSALLTAEPFLLPNHLTIDDPCLVWSATVKEPPLPPSCDYQLIRTETDEFGDLTSWKCAKCGHTFSSRYLAPARGNEWIYRACGCSNQWDTWKAAKHAADGEPAAAPKPAAPPASTPPAVGDARATPEPAAPAGSTPLDSGTVQIHLTLPPEKAADVLLYARGELEALPEFEALDGSTPPAAGDLVAAPKPAAPAESTPPDSEAVKKANGRKVTGGPPHKNRMLICTLLALYPNANARDEELSDSEIQRVWDAYKRWEGKSVKACRVLATVKATKTLQNWPKFESCTAVRAAIRSFRSDFKQWPAEKRESLERDVENTRRKINGS